MVLNQTSEAGGPSEGPLDDPSLAGEGPKPERIMIDATHLKAHRTAASLLKCSVPAFDGLDRH
ncbi:hypothetical protein HNS03_25585 [Amorphus sp. 3PC139-8]